MYTNSNAMSKIDMFLKSSQSYQTNEHILTYTLLTNFFSQSNGVLKLKFNQWYLIWNVVNCYSQQRNIQITLQVSISFTVFSILFSYKRFCLNILTHVGKSLYVPIQRDILDDPRHLWQDDVMGQCTSAFSRQILSTEANLFQEKDDKIKAVVTILNITEMRNISIFINGLSIPERYSLKLKVLIRILYFMFAS